MAVTVKIGDAANAPSVTLELDIRKSMNGDLMIFDHGDIDIVLSTSNNKVVAFPKEVVTDLVYGAQNRLFTFLRKKNIILTQTNIILTQKKWFLLKNVIFDANFSTILDKNWYSALSIWH